MKNTATAEVLYSAACASCKRVITVKCPLGAPVQMVLKCLNDEHAWVPLEKSGNPCPARIVTFTADCRGAV